MAISTSGVSRTSLWCYHTDTHNTREGGGGGGERDRVRQTDRQTERERLTGRQTYRQTEREKRQKTEKTNTDREGSD